MDYNPSETWNSFEDGEGNHTQVYKDRPTEKKTVKVHSVKLEELMKSHGVGTIKFLKVDCEGCEFLVIPQLRELIADKKKVENLAVEVHVSLSSSKDRVDETRKILHERGCDWTPSTNLDRRVNGEGVPNGDL